MYILKKDEMKIYCKFNKTKPPIDKVICKMFYDFYDNKKLYKNIEKRADKNQR